MNIPHDKNPSQAGASPGRKLLIVSATDHASPYEEQLAHQVVDLNWCCERIAHDGISLWSNPKDGFSTAPHDSLTIAGAQTLKPVIDELIARCPQGEWDSVAPRTSDILSNVTLQPPDIIIASEMSALPAATVLSSYYRVPFVYLCSRYHWKGDDLSFENYMQSSKVEGYCSRLADGIITASRVGAAKIIERYNLECPYGSLQSLTVSEKWRRQEKQRIRQEFSIPEHYRRIVLPIMSTAEDIIEGNTVSAWLQGALLGLKHVRHDNISFMVMMHKGSAISRQVTEGWCREFGLESPRVIVVEQSSEAEWENALATAEAVVLPFRPTDKMLQDFDLALSASVPLVLNRELYPERWLRNPPIGTFVRLASPGDFTWALEQIMNIDLGRFRRAYEEFHAQSVLPNTLGAIEILHDVLGRGALTRAEVHQRHNRIFSLAAAGENLLAVAEVQAYTKRITAAIQT